MSSPLDESLDVTLDDVMHDPYTRRAFERLSATKKGYTYWVDEIYKDLEYIFHKYFSTTSSFRLNDKEDRYNTEIVNTLSGWGYCAGHDTWNDGHPDIVVENKQYGYKWIAESKKHSSYNENLKGFNQICTRYSNGYSKECHGAVIIIMINSTNPLSVMQKWKQTLDDDQKYQKRHLRSWVCDDDPLCFWSEHKHHATNLDYKIKHLPLIIHFDPKDMD